GGVVMAAKGHGIGNAGVAAGEPVFDVVDIAEHRWGGAAWGLASTISGQDGSALGDGEHAFGTFLLQYGVGAVAQLGHQFAITGYNLGISRMHRPMIERLATIRGPGQLVDKTDFAFCHRLTTIS